MHAVNITEMKNSMEELFTKKIKKIKNDYANKLNAFKKDYHNNNNGNHFSSNRFDNTNVKDHEINQLKITNNNLKNSLKRARSTNSTRNDGSGGGSSGDSSSSSDLQYDTETKKMVAQLREENERKDNEISYLKSIVRGTMTLEGKEEIKYDGDDDDDMYSSPMAPKRLATRMRQNGSSNSGGSRLRMKRAAGKTTPTSSSKAKISNTQPKAGTVKSRISVYEKTDQQRQQRLFVSPPDNNTGKKRTRKGAGSSRGTINSPESTNSENVEKNITTSTKKTIKKVATPVRKVNALLEQEKKPLGAMFKYYATKRSMNATSTGKAKKYVPTMFLTWPNFSKFCFDFSIVRDHIDLITCFVMGKN